MAASKLSTLTAFLVLILALALLSTQEVQFVEAKLCEKRSQTWSGPCSITSNCDNHCKTRDGAVQGACHFDWGWACFCYYNC